MQQRPTVAGAQLAGAGGMPSAAQAAAAEAARVAAEERCIVNVWQNNLEAEVAKLRDLVDTYKYISMVWD